MAASLAAQFYSCSMHGHWPPVMWQLSAIDVRLNWHFLAIDGIWSVWRPWSLTPRCTHIFSVVFLFLSTASNRSMSVCAHVFISCSHFFHHSASFSFWPNKIIIIEIEHKLRFITDHCSLNGAEKVRKNDSKPDHYHQRNEQKKKKKRKKHTLCHRFC